MRTVDALKLVHAFMKAIPDRPSANWGNTAAKDRYYAAYRIFVDSMPGGSVAYVKKKESIGQALKYYVDDPLSMQTYLLGFFVTGGGNNETR